VLAWGQLTCGSTALVGALAGVLFGAGGHATLQADALATAMRRQGLTRYRDRTGSALAVGFGDDFVAHVGSRQKLVENPVLDHSRDRHFRVGDMAQPSAPTCTSNLEEITLTPLELRGTRRPKRHWMTRSISASVGRAGDGCFANAAGRAALGNAEG